MTYNNVVFYNYFHNGDIHTSRGFIKEMMKIIPAKNFHESHMNPPCILSDIKNLRHIPFSDFCKIGLPYMEGNLVHQKALVFNRQRSTAPFYTDGNNNLFINTWSGQITEEKPECCNFPDYLKLYNQTLSKLGLEEMCGGEKIFPSINYSFFSIDGVNEFFKNKRKSDTVLISNGDVESGQCKNFDFNPIIVKLAKNNPDIDFIVTNIMKEKLKSENIFYAEDIIKKDGCDLNEISYVSTKCNMIVGRDSGPHTFCLTKENITNKDMLNVVFCLVEKEADYGAHTYPECKMETVWSPYKNDDQVYKVIEGAIKKIKIKEVV